METVLKFLDFMHNEFDSDLCLRVFGENYYWDKFIKFDRDIVRFLLYLDRENRKLLWAAFNDNILH